MCSGANSTYAEGVEASVLRPAIQLLVHELFCDFLNASKLCLPRAWLGLSRPQNNWGLMGGVYRRRGNRVHASFAADLR